MKYLSLFSGIGGFELGIQQAYEEKSNTKCEHISEKPKQKERTQGRIGTTNKCRKKFCVANRSAPLCIGYSEFDPDCDKKDKKTEKVCKGYHSAISWDKSKCDKCGKIKTQYAIQVYEKHFKYKNFGDITKIDERELPDFDFICGGFPCQSFSIAGKRGGFEDTRGTLFFDIARIIKAKRPRILLVLNGGFSFHHLTNYLFQRL